MLDGWTAPAVPGLEAMHGRYTSLVPLDPDPHEGALFDAAQGPSSDPALWKWMSVGPFDGETFRSYLQACASSTDPLFFTVLDGGDPAGMASYMRIDGPNGVIEIGNIWFGASLQRTRSATEAIFLMIQRAFQLGYRRVEWKCDALNERSRAAALRFGFVPEGIFRNHMVVKGRNRDTAWHSIIDRDWPSLERAFIEWLSPSNFDRDGAQLRTLGSFQGRPSS